MYSDTEQGFRLSSLFLMKFRAETLQEKIAKVSIWIGMTSIIILSRCMKVEAQNTNTTFDVVINYGAIGDGQTDDSPAFQKGWRDMCAAAGETPMLNVPSGKTFLVNPVTFKGPCNSTNINIQILGNIVAPSTKYSAGSWLSFVNVDGLILNGSGQIDGRGSVWWNNKTQTEDEQNSRPTALILENCKNVEMSGLTHINSPRSHISVDMCTQVNIYGANISAPVHSPNTDGIDIARSSQVHIYNSFISTGDDCIAINNGSSYINITNITCGPGHGISVGSLGENEKEAIVEHVNVSNCTLNRTSNGARIKTWQGGSGYAKNITFQDLTILDAQNPIIIDQYYCETGFDWSNKTSTVQISGVKFTRISGTSATDNAIELRCSESVPCTDVDISDVQLVSSDPAKNLTAVCYNVEGTFTSNTPNITCSTA